MEIAVIIKKLREERGMSQEDLAKALGVTNQAVSTWETGKRLPRMGAIEKMSTLFGVSKGYIIGEDEDSAEEMILTSEERALLIAYRSAPAEVKGIIRKIVER